VNILDKVSEKQLKKDIPDFDIGDTVKVHVLIVEGSKERIQAFTGTVIARDHAGISETFTVRRLAGGLGVERVFPLHSPRVSKVEPMTKGNVRRAKLYYLRSRIGKTARVKEKIRAAAS
jgi:large subunit ribosomal protein L19